jgi:signal transduction histidine kinase
MSLFRNHPIQRKLMTMILGISTVVLLLTCATFLGYEWLTYRRSAMQQLATLGDIIAVQSTAAVAFENQKDGTEILAALKAEHHIVAACLYDQQGRVFSRYPAGASDATFPTAPGADGYRFEGSDLIGFTPVVQVRGSDRFGTLFLRSDSEAIYDRLRLYGGLAALIAVLATVVAYLLSRMVQREISHPILELAQTAQAVSFRRDYSVRATRHGEDELGTLTDAFNHMLAVIQEQNEELERRVRERTAELEAANDELEAFGSSAAHDLRTPLRAVAGFADVLLDPRAKIPPEEAQRYIRMIRDGTGQMSELIDDLLAFSRLGRQALARQTVDLTALCADVRQELAREPRARPVEWRLHPLAAAEGDPGLLRLVFVNLLSNALKYTQPHPAAVIEVGMAPEAEQGAPVYFVRDNGVGFDMRDADKLFGVFQRLHPAHEFEGTGVGLATVRRIVERHGGCIWAEATPDRGATFFFTLAPDTDLDPVEPAARPKAP